MLDEHGERVDPGHTTADLTLLTTLVDELLDAHVDTVELALGFEDDLAWNVHLEYLRALQRQGQMLLARIGSAQAFG
jgi:hypothetical protein